MIFPILLLVNIFYTSLSTTETPTSAPTFSPTAPPTPKPSVDPSFQPTRSPTAYPTLFPTVYLQPKNLGYYYSMTYFGVTCDNIVGNEDTVILMSGNSFGNCLVAYNESGYPLESSSYVSTCEMDGSSNSYIAYFTEYYDTACQNPKSAPTLVYYDAGCSTSGDTTTQYYCIPSSKTPPFDSLSGGYVKGYTSTLTDCKNGLPHSFTWVKSNECVDEYSSSTNLNTSQKFSCTSDSTSKILSYQDGTCSKALFSQSVRVTLCEFQYHSTEVYNNYVYGNCQGSHSSSSNDDVSMSNEDYAGVITGTLIAGMILGAIIGAVVLLGCLRFSKV